MKTNFDFKLNNVKVINRTEYNEFIEKEYPGRLVFDLKTRWSSISHNGCPHVLAGFVEYMSYVIPIVVLYPYNFIKNLIGNDNGISVDINELEDSELDFITDNFTLNGVINIGSYIWEKLDKESLEPLMLYHVANVILPDFFCNIIEADKFVINNVGYLEYSDSIISFNKLMKEFCSEYTGNTDYELMLRSGPFYMNNIRTNMLLPLSGYENINGRNPVYRINRLDSAYIVKECSYND